MPLQVNEKEKDDMAGGKDACLMEASGWSFRQQSIGNESITSVTINGQDVILIEDIGTPYRTLKPLQGDFGVISKLMHDGERWFENHRRDAAGLNLGHSIWIEWKHACLNAALSIDEFFESYLTQDAAPAPAI